MRWLGPASLLLVGLSPLGGCHMILPFDSLPDARDRDMIGPSEGPGLPDGQLEAGLAADLSPDSGSVEASSPDLPSPDSHAGQLVPCLAGGNILHLVGEPGDYITQGQTMTVTLGTWTQQAAGSPPDAVSISISGSSWWSVGFSTKQLGHGLKVGLYPSAERYLFESAGHPGLGLSGNGKGCNTLCGAFQLQTFQASAGQIVELLATFEQHCECGASRLTGCVHFKP